MTPSVGGVAALLGDVLRRVRRDAIVAAAAAVLAVVPLALLLAWLLGGARAWAAPSVAPLLIDLAALALAGGLAFLLFRRWVHATDERRIAASTEAQLGLAPGALVGVLELTRDVPGGVSAALYRRAERRLALELARAPDGALGGALRRDVERRRRNLVVGTFAFAAAVGVLGFATPERAKSAWAPLVRPVAHLEPPKLAPLQVQPGNASVPRGSSLGVRIVAAGREAVTLRWRAAGDVPRRRVLEVARDEASGRIANVDAPLVYWVEAPDGARSDSFRVVPVDPLLLADLVVDVLYPAYLAREAEQYRGEVPPLELPAGTELRIAGRANRALGSATLLREDGATRVPLRADGANFRARWSPRTSGVYQWTLTDARDAAVAVGEPLMLTLTPDAAPTVEIVEPASDGVFGPDLRQNVTADARDDHGVRAATLVSWRVSALGEREPPREERIPLGQPAEHWIINGLLDATARGMLPGDTLHYFVRVVDNSPAAQAGVSRTLSLRIPGMEEIRERVRDEAETMAREASRLGQSARELETATRELSRRGAAQSARAGEAASPQRGASGTRSGEMQYREAERARQILAQQESLVRDVEEMRERADALERALQAAGLEDAELRARMQELRDLYDRILTPELRAKMEALRQSLEDLDPGEVQRALEELSKNQEEFRKRVEESMELLRRAAAEQRMNELAQRARELAAQQQALAEAMRQQPTPRQSEQQSELAERADSLQQQIEQLQQQLEKQGEQRAAQSAGDAADKVDSAREKMTQAAQGKPPTERDTYREPGKEEEQPEKEGGKGLPLPKLPSIPKPQVSIGEKPEQRGGSSLPTPQTGQSGASQGASAQPKDKSGASGEQNKSGQESGEKSQAGEQSGKQQGAGKQAGGEQPGGQQGGGQPSNAQQAASQLEDAARTLEAARKSMAEGWKQEARETVQQSTNEALTLAQRQAALQQQMDAMRQRGQMPSEAEMARLRAEQMALKQSLEAMGQNLSDAGKRTAMLSRDVGSAMGRSMLSMEQTLQGMQGQNAEQRLPVEEAGATVDALNRLALALLQNGERIDQSETGTGLQEALQQLAEMAQQQGALNGQASSLLPMGLSPQALATQLQAMAERQREIARRLGGVNDMLGGQEDVLGRLDDMAREADQIARDLAGGRLTPETLRRQERLFHRLLDAGRTLEREETSEERSAGRPGELPPSFGRALDPALMDGPRYRISAEQLRALPPAYRRMILEYFDRLNAAEPRPPAAGRAPEGRQR